MAYADALDPAIPAGGDKRKLGDDAIRQLTRAVRQRLSSIFVDIDADPLVLKPGVIGTGMLVDTLITTIKLADLNVTTAKLADRAVTAIKLGLGAVQPEHIGAGAFSFPDVNSTAGFTVGGVAPAASKFLKSDGAHFIAGDILSADIPDAILQKLLIRAEGWYVSNLPVSSASFLTRWSSNLGVDRHYAIMTRAGEIRQMFIRGEADRTAGSFTVQLAKSNVAMAGAIATIDAANPRQVIVAFAAGAQPFAAGDFISLNWSTVGFAPNNTTHIAGFEFRYTA